jgi:hypothetical protein
MHNAPAVLALLASLHLSAAAFANEAPQAAPSTQPADAFLAAIARHCGQAYAGRITANEPANPDDPFNW